MSNDDYPYERPAENPGQPQSEPGNPSWDKRPQGGYDQQGQTGDYGPPAQQGGYDQQGNPGQNYGQQGGYGGPSAPPPPAGFDVMQQSKGFFGALFDFSFTHFVTPIIVKAVYILVTIGLVLGWLGFTLVSFSESAGAGLAVFLFGAVLVLIYLALVRMTLEFYLAVVRMSEDIHQRLR